MSRIVAHGVSRNDRGQGGLHQRKRSPKGPPAVRSRRAHRWRILIVVGTIGLAAVGYRYRTEPSRGPSPEFLTIKVQRDNLVVTVVEDGNVESAKNVDVKCEVPGPITILEIVADGTAVTKGDVLVRLDSSKIDDEILAQQIVVAKAEGAKVKAEKEYLAADIAVEEYREATFVQEMQEAEADLTIAQQHLASAENLLFYSRRMHRKGFVTAMDVQSKEFAVKEAQLEIDKAAGKKLALEKYTKRKMLEELTSKRDAAEATSKAESAAFAQEQMKLKRYQEQLAKCTIYAPQDGMVVYANDMLGAGQSGPKVEQGAQVTQFQPLVRLPDLKSMQVKCLVHETKVDQLRAGMPVKIMVQDREFRGRVASIANQPEPSGFWQGFVKEYAVIAVIDGQPEELKPGKTAEVTVTVEERKQVLLAPVQCVVDRDATFYAWVLTETGVVRRELLVGKKNDTMVEIIDGLKEGESVVLNPRTDNRADGEAV